MIIQRYAVIDPINLGNNLGIFMIIMMDNNDDYPMVTQRVCNYIKKNITMLLVMIIMT